MRNYAMNLFPVPFWPDSKQNLAEQIASAFPPGYASKPLRLAHAYVPWQHYNVVFEPAEALRKGTIFPELYMPQGEYGPCEGPQPCGGVFHGFK